MPHKRAKKSVRDAATSARGYDNAPTTNDQFTVAHENHTAAQGLGKGVMAPKEEGEEGGKNKRRKAAKKEARANVDSFGGRGEFGGMSKNLHRILNAGATREQYNAERKRKREEENGGAGQLGPNGGPSKKKATALTPLPYESLSTFNRRVEIAMRPSIDTAIKASKGTGKKDRAKAKKADAADAAAAEEEDAKAQAEADAAKGKGKGKEKEKEAVDPLVPPVKPQPVRTGPTEFAPASQVRSLTELVMAPPSLKKARRGLKAAPSTHDAMPAGRMPISDDIAKAIAMEREKAVRMYREMKEKREAEKRAEK